MNLRYFNNEIISIKKDAIDSKTNMSDAEINRKYASGEIRIVTEQGRYPLNTIVSMVTSGQYILDPDFQRRHRWNKERKSRLIESFIMNVPIPPIFLYETDYAVYEVMDGLQRLTAIYEFYQDKYPLQGLEYWVELEGKYYKDLPLNVKQGIDRRYLSSVILLKETARDSEMAALMKKLVFERLNSGGIKLEYQESRNALYHGPFNSMTVELSKNEYFRKIMGIPYQAKETPSYLQKLEGNHMYSTMRDVEYVVRFFAMRHIDKWESETLNRFLDKFTASANQLDKTVLDQYCALFTDTIKFAYDLFGLEAFRIWKMGEDNKLTKRDNRPHSVLYDPLMQVLSQRLENKNYFIQNKRLVQKELKNQFELNPILSDGRKSFRAEVIQQRIQILDRMFDNI